MPFRNSLAVVALCLSACAPSVNAVARQASKAAVDEGAEELTRADTQESIKQASQDPQLQAAASNMTEQVTEGVLKALDSEQAHVQITSLTRSAMQEVLAGLSSPHARERFAGLTSSIADAALDQIGTRLNDGFRPALRAAIQEDIAQGLAGALRSEQLEPALGHAVQTVAYHAVMGANEGLGAAWLGSNGMLGQARTASGSIAGMGLGWLWVGLAVLGMLTLMLVSVAVMMLARARRSQAEVERLESATLLLATAMRERQHSEQSDEIVAIVQQALEGRAEKSGKHRIMGALGMRKAG